MKALSISDPETIVLGIQDEIRRSADARYDHRLHGILLIAQGYTCPEVAKLLGDSVRTVENWVRQFEINGLAGLVDQDRPGRPKRLAESQLDEIKLVLREPPSAVGFDNHMWDGKTLSAYIDRIYSVTMGVRQAQRLFRQLGFRLRKLRPVISHADPEVQAAYKKT